MAIAPWFIGFLAFEFGPLLSSLYLSFTKFDVLTTPKWVGFKNWDKMLFNDPLVWHSLKVTAIYSVGAVSLGLVLGLSLALLLNQDVGGLSFYRTVFYTPAVVSGAAVAMMWLLLPQPGSRRHQSHPRAGRNPRSRLALRPDLGTAGLHRHEYMGRRRRHGPVPGCTARSAD